MKTMKSIKMYLGLLVAGSVLIGNGNFSNSYAACDNSFGGIACDKYSEATTASYCLPPYSCLQDPIPPGQPNQNGCTKIECDMCPAKVCRTSTEGCTGYTCSEVSFTRTTTTTYYSYSLSAVTPHCGAEIGSSYTTGTVSRAGTIVCATGLGPTY